MPIQSLREKTRRATWQLDLFQKRNSSWAKSSARCMRILMPILSRWQGKHQSTLGKVNPMSCVFFQSSAKVRFRAPLHAIRCPPQQQHPLKSLGLWNGGARMRVRRDSALLGYPPVGTQKWRLLPSMPIPPFASNARANPT